MGEQESIQQQFIREIADSIFQQSVNGKDSEEKCFFKLRFDPENEKLDNQNKNNNDIVSLMNQKLGYSPSNIQRFQKEKVIPAIVKKYEQQMKADELDIESILNAKRGENDVWKRVYSWLWDKQFPRYLWEALRKEADEKNQDWIRFVDDSLVSSEREFIIKTAKKEPKTIPINQSLDLEIKVDPDYCNYHLLLFNQNLKGFHLICPTEVFAPNNKIEETPWSMPTEGSIEFITTGTEEFLGIVIEQPLELEWLKLSENLQFEPKHLVKLWEQLEKNKNWRLFYQSFEVV
ncbi:hypothetical protein VB834_01285 [Limnoraphis robusta Tam1]|uniref:DUF4384 domain-containing protein n=1 Tax=Limnoraphis robusta CCNP1315 TaxID=3110306 RepID=A0ABU5TZY5_9CYAN|nr:hypothetical protein [Limnoraphis robusta]MEA5497668.1 hypothetical protein [Limnoraphis robusta BA-68 BA1]MEA5520496.1 hypothetical protein [Limnoraphis robusta CCNP1315]MEA5537658.1 hypothetical protein [Limnoraphis robusta Tam1]MEA5547009.1 hypothetical protein [Limnoraphis robusta CCNP1324]